MDTVLNATDIKVHYGGVRAVDGVTFGVPQARLHGLVGPNGSGKSTFLGALSRMTDLTEGTLSFLGQRYEKSPAAEVARMGVRRTFQTVRLLPDATVMENVMVGADSPTLERGVWRSMLMPRRGRREERRAREAARRSINLLGLEGMEKLRAGTLPYGTQRRIEIARAVAGQPQVLLLDEPTAGMSRSERDAIGRIFRELLDEGIALVLVEHDLELITTVCDHLSVMHMGRLMAEGAPLEVVQRVDVVEAYTGRWER
jgi:branched-chain amino acid transport system ATP-binding protein